MGPPERLGLWTRDALAAGHTPEAVAAAAEQAGWTAPEARAALELWSVTPGLPPAPRPDRRRRIDAGDALRHSILFLALWGVVLNIGYIAFDLIDARFGAGVAAGDAEGVRYAVAALTVCWVVWAWQTMALAHASAAGRPASTVGRWLTAIGLFVAAGVIITDATIVLGALLGGQAEIVFLLDALVVAALAAAVFLAYRADLEPVA